MKKSLLFSVALAASAAVSAQTTVWSCDFENATPVEVGICTYAKDMAANGTELSQMQPVEGWTMGVENKDGRAAGVFEYGSGAWLGSWQYAVPAEPADGGGNNCLGVLAVWTATTQYLYPITLEAGSYTLTAEVYNLAGIGAMTMTQNLIGFVGEDGDVAYLAPNKLYAIGIWTTETVTFTLDEATKGYISVGYTAPNSGFAVNQHLFIDNLELTAVTALDVEWPNLERAIANAKNQSEKYAFEGNLFFPIEGSRDELLAAIEAAEAIERDNTTVEEVKAMIERLEEACPVVLPDPDAKYVIANVNSVDEEAETALYMTVENGEGVTLSADECEFSFVAVEGGYWNIVCGDKYVGMAGTTKWTMSNTVATNWIINALPDGTYSIQCDSGLIGSDKLEEGAPCYGDKGEAANGKWHIALVEEEEYECLYQSIALTCDAGEDYNDNYTPYLQDAAVAIEAYSNSVTVRAFAGVEGYDLDIEFDEDDNVVSVAPVVNGEYGNAVTSGYCKVSTGLDGANKYWNIMVEYCYANSDAEEKSGYVCLIFADNAKNWLYYYIYWDEDIATGVTTAKAVKCDNAIYNLAGQRLAKMQKGINIVDGKKVVVR